MQLSSIFLLVSLLISVSSEKKVILISLDGFRHDYIDIARKGGANVSAFDELRKSGFAAEVQNVFVTNTFPTHFAIATGRYVENHGLVDNNFRDDRLNDSFSYKSNTNALDPKWLNYGGNEPIWITNQRHGGQSCVFYWPGSNAEFKGRYPFATYGLYTDYPSFQYRVDRVMDWLPMDEFSLCVMYYPEPDASGHKFGPNSEQVLKAIEIVNEGIAYLLQRIRADTRLNGKVNVVVTADHGMADIPAENRIPFHDLDNYKKFRTVVSPTSVGFHEADDANIEKLYGELEAKKIPNAKLYLKKNMPERFHYSKSHRIPPVMLFADMGYLIESAPGQYETGPRGTHGYDNENPEMHPFMVAAGPDIQTHTDKQHFHQIDIYPFVCALLELQKPNLVDGQITRVLPFLKNPPTQEYLDEFELYASGIKTDKK